MASKHDLIIKKSSTIKNKKNKSIIFATILYVVDYDW